MHDEWMFVIVFGKIKTHRMHPIRQSSKQIDVRTKQRFSLRLYASVNMNASSKLINFRWKILNEL